VTHISEGTHAGMRPKCWSGEYHGLAKVP